MNNIPIPADIPLPIPGSVPFFKALLIVSLILHLIFVGITLGGTILSLLSSYLGYKKKDERYTRLSHTTAKFSFVNKSIAIVLGVAPMLLISVLNTGFFYSSSIIIGKVWMSLVPLLIIAFLMIYVYEMKMWEIAKGRIYPLVFGVGGCLLLLFIPLIFAVNMVLMRLPQLWLSTHSFWQAVFYATVIPRYFHFIFASFVMTGLMIYIHGCWGAKKAFRDEDASYYNWSARFGTTIALHASLGQVVFGTLLFFSHDTSITTAFLTGGLNTWLLVAALALVFLMILLLYRQKKELGIVSASLHTAHLSRAHDETAAALTEDGRRPVGRWWVLPALLLVLLMLMGLIRHQIREMSLEPFQQHAKVDAQQMYTKYTDTGKQVNHID